MNDKNVTISRSLAENLEKYLGDDWDPVHLDCLEELRAILAAPIVEADGMGEAVVIGNLYRSAEDQLEIELVGNPKITDGMKLYASQPAPVSVPDGWKLVPIEPTEAMLNVLHDRVLISVNSRKQEASILNDKAWWKAVVDSAPTCLDKVKELNQ